MGPERKKRRGCGDRAISVRGEAGGSRTDGETTGDVVHRKQQRMGELFRKKTWRSFSKAETSAGAQKENNFLGQCLSDFFVAVVKHPHQRQLMGQKELVWASHSRGLRVHHGREAWQKTAGMVIGAGS